MSAAHPFFIAGARHSCGHVVRSMGGVAWAMSMHAAGEGTRIEVFTSHTVQLEVGGEKRPELRVPVNAR